MALLPAVATVSLGRSSAGHSLFRKLQEAADHSFQGIELFYECFEYHARSLPGGLCEGNLILAAVQTRQECDRLKLEVVCLQPLLYAEGNTSIQEHAELMQQFQLWLRLAKILRTDMIQVPTNFRQQNTTGDIDRITADMAELARLASLESPVVRLAYEGVAWGTHIDTWEGTWDIVKRVGMPNLGLCLDTFHIAGRIWADPTSSTGRSVDGDVALSTTLARMSSELDVGKIFYVQAGDAERLHLLGPGHPLYLADQPERMTWSRNARLFAYEIDRGGYLPTTPILDVIVKTLGFRGWISMESFSKELYDEDTTIPEQYARRAQVSWEKMQKLY